MPCVVCSFWLALMSNCFLSLSSVKSERMKTDLIFHIAYWWFGLIYLNWLSFFFQIRCELLFSHFSVAGDSLIPWLTLYLTWCIETDSLKLFLRDSEEASKGTFPRLVALQTMSRGVIQAKSWFGGGGGGDGNGCTVRCSEAFYCKCAIKRKH